MIHNVSSDLKKQHVFLHLCRSGHLCSATQLHHYPILLHIWPCLNFALDHTAVLLIFRLTVQSWVFFRWNYSLCQCCVSALNTFKISTKITQYQVVLKLVCVNNTCIQFYWFPDLEKKLLLLFFFLQPNATSVVWFNVTCDWPAAPAATAHTVCGVVKSSTMYLSWQFRVQKFN